MAYGVVAPFVAQLAGAEPGATALRSCGSCSLTFFDHRYSDAEMAAIYSSYRQGEYLRVRQRWEPWYRRAVNDTFSGQSPAVLERRRFVERQLDHAGLTDRDFGVVVDLGGDEGQFFPDVRCSRRVLVDVSDKPLPCDVSRAASLAEVAGPVGLVLISHVLEHLADPLGVIREAAAVLTPGGVIYVEVPLDRPRTRARHRSSRHLTWTLFLARHRVGWIAADFATGLSRQRGWRVPRLGVVKESEHINYFSDRSLRDLLRCAGFHVMASLAEPDATMGGIRLGRLGVVASLRPEQQREPRQ